MLTTSLAVIALALILIVLVILVYRSNPGTILRLLQDPEGLRRAEEELKLKSELLDAATDSVFLHDADLRILYLNRTAYESRGYAREELLSMGIRPLIAPEFEAKSEARIKAVMDQGETVFESGHIRKDGSIMPVEIHDRVIELENSRTILSIVRDITDRKRAEGDLREAIQTLESLVQSSPLGISTLDRDGNVTMWNLACERIFGWTKQEVLGRPNPTIPREEYEASARLMEASLEGKTLANKELRLLRKDGSLVDISLSTASIFDANDDVVASIGIIADISERKELEDQLAERARLAGLGAEVGVSLTRGESLRDALEQCADALVRNLEVAAARIWTLGGEGSVLELQASAGLYTNLDGAHSRLSVERSKIGLIARELRPEIIDSTEDGAAFADPEWAEYEQIVAFAGYPLVIENRPVGVVAIFSRHPITEFTLRALSAVADQISLGIKQKQAQDALLSQFRQFSAVFDSINAVVYVADMETHQLLYLNRYGGELFGAENLGNPCYQVLQSGQTAPCSFCTNFRLVHEGLPGPPYVWEFQNTMNGRWYLCVDRAITWEGGRLVRMEVAVDVTDRKRNEESFRSMAEHSPIGIYIARKGKFRFVNARFQACTGYGESELLGAHTLRLVLPGDREMVRENALQMLRGKRDTPYEYRIVDKVGNLKWILETVSAFNYEGRQAIVGNFVDITERRNLEQQLAHLATHDPLTGLPNRRSLEETLDRVTARARRDVASVLLFLDLDNFKEINDVKGHAAGDKALAAVAHHIQEQLRAEDLLVRVGGDEFAVVLEGATTDDFWITAERIRLAVKGFRLPIDGSTLNLTVSLGGVAIDGQHTPQMHLSRADAAMYKAKAEGGDRIMLYE